MTTTEKIKDVTPGPPLIEQRAAEPTTKSNEGAKKGGGKPPGRGNGNGSGALKSESQLVTFLLNGEEFGFNIMNVQEIIRPPKIARMPRMPGYVDGVANLRGVVLPIIDTRERFGIARVDDTDRTRVLVIDNQGEKTGLRVDRVKQVTRVADSDIEPPPGAIQGRGADYLSGMVKLEQGKRIIMALDPAKVCRVELTQAAGGEVARKTQAAAQAASAGAKQVEVEQLVTFKLGADEFAFQIDRVREILRVEQPKELPDSPDYILGVLTVRGQIMSIVDLRCLLQQKSLADEVCAQVHGLREGFGAGVLAAKAVVSAKDLHPVNVAFLEAARQWFGAFKTSSQKLMEQVSLLRAANDDAIRQAHVASSLRSEFPDESRRLFENEVLRQAARVFDGFADLDKAVRENIREDQRIVVVDVDGLLLGLVVDQVKEVLNVPKNLIDAPPQVGGESGLQLSGIAKLNDGARLIMLLNAVRLLQTENLKNLQQQATSGAAKTRSGDDKVAETRGDTSEQHLVTFRLGDEEFGVPISQIQEIDRHSKITRVPRAPPFVEGVTNLRGEVVPVIDARKRFGLAPKEPDDRTRIIIVDLGGTKTGLVVDSVSQVLNLALRDIAPPPSAIEAGIDNEFISGIGKVDNGKRMVVLLNMEKILTGKEQLALAQAANRAVDTGQAK